MQKNEPEKKNKNGMKNAILRKTKRSKSRKLKRQKRTNIRKIKKRTKNSSEKQDWAKSRTDIH